MVNICVINRTLTSTLVYMGHIERFHFTSQSRDNHALLHFGVQLGVQSMLAYSVVIGRSKGSGRDTGVSFHRVTKIITH